MNRTALLLMPLIALVGLAGGCREENVATPTGFTQPSRAPDQTYTVRGQIKELPLAGNRHTELKVEHEAIDTFVNGEGKSVGMGTMVMEFPPAKGVSLAGLAIGDKVELSFSVWWDKGAATWCATKVAKLPADTKLEFGRATPPPVN